MEKHIKTIKGNETGTYRRALARAGAKILADTGSSIRYISPKTGSEMIAHLSEMPYDCDGCTETVSVWEVTA